MPARTQCTARPHWLAISAALCIVLTACGDGKPVRAAQQSEAPRPTQSRLLGEQPSAAPPTTAGRRHPTVVAAGDISTTWIAGQKSTSKLVRRLDPTRVLALGDLQYPRGALRDYRRYYDRTWGRFKKRTRPAPGNHEYLTEGARGYRRYFGSAAKSRGHTYYSFDLGSWHLVALNANIDRDADSKQVRWLKADLKATNKPCVLAYWHQPRFSSGSSHGSDSSVLTFWKILFRKHADVVLNGHEHNYERFRKQTPHGRFDKRGIRQFVVGTGGAGLYPFGAAQPNSRKRISSSLGVLRLTLRHDGYRWKFVSVGGDVLDRGGPRRCN